MNLIKQHIEYLKDNPQGYWFKSKLYGYGWTPARPAGWATISLYILFLLGIIWYVDSSNAATQSVDSLLSAVIGITILFLAICWKTGEPLKWQWGQKEIE